MRFFISLMIAIVCSQISFAQCTTPEITPIGPTAFCQGESVQLSTDAVAGLTYQWKLNGVTNVGDNAATYIATASGFYSVTISDESVPCTSTSNPIDVTVNSLPTATITPATSTTFCQGGSVVLNANTGTGLSYQWRLNGTNISGATGVSYTANASGSYTVVVTSASTCSTTSTATVVTVNALPTATITPATTTTFCQGGSVVLNANTGAGLTYQWYNNATAISGATTSSYTANGNGSFTVVVSNSNSCSNTSSATSVVVNLVPDVLDPDDLIYCSGDTVPTIVFVSPSDVSGTYFEWQNSTPAIGIPANGNNNINSFTSQNVSDSILIATISVMPKTSFCNGTPQQFFITIKPKPSITSNLQESICTEQQFTFNPVNGTNGIVPENTFLSWTVNNTNVIGEENNSNSEIGTISQTLTNTTYANNQVVYNVIPVSNGCPGNPFNYTVTVLKAPRLLVSPTSSICFGNSIQLFAVDSLNSGQLFYSWNNSSTLNNPYIFNPIASPEVNTSYSVSVTDYTTQCQITRSVTVDVSPLPASTTTYAGSSSICQGSSLLLNANEGAGLTYQWKLNDVPLSGQTDSTYAATIAGVYTVVVTNSSGCSKTSQGVSVSVNPLPVADISSLSSTSFCEGQSVFLNTTNVIGNTYQWKLNGNNIPNATSSGFNAATSGNYSVTVLNSATQCSNTSPTLVITVNPLPTASITPQGGTVCQGESVTMQANSSAGLTYQWRLNDINIPNATASTYSATSSGIYSVVVSNATCSKTSGGVTVNVNPLPIADISNLSATTFCQGESVILNTTYVVGNTYQWKLNGNNIQNANLYSYEAVQAGLYSVVVTNANSCDLQSPSINVNVNPLPVINVSADDYILCQGETTVVHASGAMNYSWNPAEWVSNSSSANTSVFPTSTMNFGVTGTDQNGCSNYDELQIVVSSFPSLDLPETIETCHGATVNLLGAAELSWSGITTSNQFIAGESGYAIGTSQNANFCISKDSIFIQVHELPTPTISGANAICANASNVTYTVPSTGNLFFWNVSNGDLQGVDNGNTAYVHWFDQVYGPDVFVTITEHDVHTGCEGSDTLEVILDGLAPNPVIVSLLYPNGNTLYSSEHYAVMNWGSTVIANDVDEYTDGHFQYYSYENFDTALRYYWVEVGDDESCVTRSYYNAPVWQIGIEEEQKQESIHVYPNPVTAFLNISAERNTEIIEISIYNCAGELVLIEANPLGLSNIDMSLYPTGVYMLRLKTMDNHFLNYKIIKQ